MQRVDGGAMEAAEETSTPPARPPSARRQRWADRENARRRAVYSTQLTQWRRIDDELTSLAATARTFHGYEGDEAPGEVRLITRPDERVFGVVARATLLRSRRTATGSAAAVPGYTEYSALGTSQLAALRARATFADRNEQNWEREYGALTITDQRVVFHGGSRDWEWSLDHLVGVEHADALPRTLIRVSDREELSGLAYSSAQAPLLRLLLGLAVAHRAGTVEEFVDRIEADLARHGEAQPTLLHRADLEDAPGPAVAALQLLSAVYIGRAGQPTRWRVAQCVAAIVATAGILALVIPHPWPTS